MEKIRESWYDGFTLISVEENADNDFDITYIDDVHDGLGKVQKIVLDRLSIYQFSRLIENIKNRIALNAKETPAKVDPLQFMLDCPKTGESCMCQKECMYKRH